MCFLLNVYRVIALGIEFKLTQCQLQGAKTAGFGFNRRLKGTYLFNIIFKFTFGVKIARYNVLRYFRELNSLFSF